MGKAEGDMGQRDWCRSIVCCGALLLVVGLWAAAAAAAGAERVDGAGRFPQLSLGQSGDEAEEWTGERGNRGQSCGEWAAKVNRWQERMARWRPAPRPDLPDVAYGNSRLERFDVFLPRGTSSPGPAPIIALVHGGGWCVGDKANNEVVSNKVARWQNRGFVVVSVNYPMVNEGSDALDQAHHLGRAVAAIQARAGQWGSDGNKLILMGHSAGAHLVSLLHADAQLRNACGVGPLLGVISLDAGALDVLRQMPQVYPFLKIRYTEAFGESKEGWRAASPLHRLQGSVSPWLGVCSTKRKDDPCAQARIYAAKSMGLGARAEVLPLAMTHRAINEELGLPGEYTVQVEAFMAGLDAEVGRRLQP